MDKTDYLIAELRMRIGDVERLPDELQFFDDVTTLTRFLKARDWNLDESEKLLRAAIEWRRTTKPLTVDCKWCHENPGYHSVRQVGFDEINRPVIYANFCQASTHKYTVEDSIAHVTYLIENAKITMPEGIHQWVFVMDCTGMTLSACSPKLGYGLTSIMSNFYPERLGLVICLNHNRVFQGVWKAFKVFLHPNTIAKMQLVRSKKKIKELFEKHFNEELIEWLTEEIKLNKASKLSDSQREFWNKPTGSGTHDPRGTASYIARYIEGQPAAGDERTHKPHPNIVDVQAGKSVHINTAEVDAEREKALRLVAASSSPDDDNSNSGDESFDNFEIVDELEIPEDEQIPKDAKPFSETVK